MVNRTTYFIGDIFPYITIVKKDLVEDIAAAIFPTRHYQSPVIILIKGTQLKLID